VQEQEQEQREVQEQEQKQKQKSITNCQVERSRDFLDLSNFLNLCSKK
jgi:hypothetical protein